MLYMVACGCEDTH